MKYIFHDDLTRQPNYVINDMRIQRNPHNKIVVITGKKEEEKNTPLELMYL